MNITFQPKIDLELAPAEVQAPSRAVTPDGSEVQRHLMPERSHIARNKAARAIQNVTAQGQVFSGSSELVEQAFYWFLTAPALVYVLYIAFGF